jgi:3'-phosphoadenosine 5'-phosphosulfate sulfotransferase (PAPS reductase)/FAD synthetase
VPALTRDWRSQYLAWSETDVHQRRVAMAVDVIERAAARGTIAIAMSWGKDSVAVADLVLATIGGRVPVYHLAHAYPLPGSEHVEQHFRSRTDVHVVPPSRSVDDVIAWLSTNGLGYERGRSSTSKAGQHKKDGGAEWATVNGIDVTIMGMRAEEAPGRRAHFKFNGLIFTRQSGVTTANPLGWWEARDVWAYIATRDLPYHRLYDCETHGQTRETLRNAGWLTTIGAQHGLIAWLAHHFSAEYRRLEAAFPRVRMLR